MGVWVVRILVLPLSFPQWQISGSILCIYAFQESDKPNVHVTTYKAYLTSLKDGLTEDDLREYFSCFGNVESIDIPINNVTGKYRGFGFVTFSDYDSVDKVVCKYCSVS